MVKVGEIEVVISASTSKLRANLAQASSLIRDFSLLSQGLTGGISEAFRQVSDVAIKGLQVGIAALVGSFTLAAKTGAEFEDEMLRAFTIMKEGGNAAVDSLSKMTTTALELGRETLFSAIDAAQGMQVLARAGFNTREVLDSIGPVMNLAIADNLELAESADIVIAALRGFSLETRDASRVTDILALGASKANTNVSTLGEAFKYVAPVAAGMGISIEETVAAIGLLSDSGLKGCYDEETDVLTIEGFKKWSEVSMEDSFATINPSTHEIEYQKPLGLINAPYKGKMYVVKNRNIDLKVTPNHWMYVRRRDKNEFERIKAEDVFGKEVEYLVTGNWIGKSSKFFILDGLQQNRGCWVKKIEPLKIDMEDWVEFIGYYLSEGSHSYNKGSYRVYISQNKGSTFESIKKCLDRLPFHYNIVKGNRNCYNFVIMNQQLYNYVSKFGNCYNKYIPEDIKNLDKRYLAILYESFRKGDGDAAGCLYTSSIKLRDDFEEVLLKLGFGVKHKKVIEKGKESIIDGRTVYSKADGWKVNINKKYLTPCFCQSDYKSPKHGSRVKGLGTTIVEKWEDYDGRIYCAEVPNHLLIVRRNGRIIVCGNSLAGTTLRRAFSELISPTQKSKKILDELGVTTVTASGKLRPFANILSDLKTKGMTAAQAMEVFGLRGGPGMVALLSRGSGALRELTVALENSKGTAEDMSQAFRTTVKGRVRDLVASVVDLGLAFSEKFKKPLAEAIFSIRNFVVDIVNIGNRMGVFKTIITGVQDALKPITNLIKELAVDFKNWLATLTAKDVLQFFSSIKKGIEGFIESFKKGELGAIVKDTLSVFIGLGKIVIGTVKAIAAAWLALPQGIRDVIRPIMIVVGLMIQLFGGVLNIVFLMVALNALWASLGLKITVGALALASLKSILLFILPIVAVIGAALAGWTLGSLIGELPIVKGYFAALFVLVGAIGPSLKLAAMGMLAFQQPWRLLNKQFRADMAATIEDIKIRAGALEEIDWLGKGEKKNKKGKDLLEKNKTNAGGGYVEIGGYKIDLKTIAANEEVKAIKKMIGQSEKIGGILGPYQKVSLLAGLQDRLNELEKIIMEQEGTLTALTRQNIKPEADRLNKSRIGAGLE